MLTTHTYHGHSHAAPADRLVLTYEDRFLRRKVLVTASGTPLLVDLAKTTSLDHGGVLITTEGAEIAIEAAAEPLLAVTGPDMRASPGISATATPRARSNRPRLLIQPDHVIADMLSRIGATVTEVIEAFTPEGGAYGHGRTHGHDHTHSHGPEGHTHDH